MYWYNKRRTKQTKKVKIIINKNNISIEKNDTFSIAKDIKNKYN